MSTRLHSVPPPGDDPEDRAGPITVVLADDHVLVRRSLRALLEREHDVAVLGEADDLTAARERVREHSPDVLVLDLLLRDGSSLQAIGELREQAPDTRAVVLTAEDNPLFAEHALAAGALGFVLKELADVELPEALRAAVRGARFVSPLIEAKLASYRTIEVDDALTARELEVLRLIALGHTSAEVARILEVSPRTVESHRARIHAKLGLATRPQLVQYALRHGMLGV